MYDAGKPSESVFSESYIYTCHIIFVRQLHFLRATVFFMEKGKISLQLIIYRKVSSVSMALFGNFVIVTFIVFDKKVEYLSAMFGEFPTSLEQGINLFYGRLPFKAALDGTETFAVPFDWMISYLLLAVLIGSHLQDDMTGFGFIVIR